MGATELSPRPYSIPLTVVDCGLLERPGRWRIVGILTGLLLALAPSLGLVFAGDGSAPTSLADILSGGFGRSLIHSLLVALAVACLSVLLGLPVGVFAGLYDFPLRRLLLALLALPLLVPSFICALGLSMLRIALGLPSDSFLSGFSGTTLVFTTFGLPLVIFVTLASMRGISQSQMDSARLAGGQRHLVKCIALGVLPVAALTGLLAGVLTLSEPGPGQILGYPSSAAVILVSFASQYDFTLAAAQCLLLAGVVLAISLPITGLLAPRLASGLLARDVKCGQLTRTGPTRVIGPALFLTLFALTTLLPLLGLALPLLRSFPLERALHEVARTWVSTGIYGVGASAVATLMGIALALCAGRSPRSCANLLAGMLLLLSLPPSLSALGFAHIASLSPASLDPVLRGQATVSLCLALRLMPVAAIFAMRSFGTSSPSWAAAAALHGVPLARYLRQVLAPWMASAMLPAALLIGLLAVADVSTTLLLHPPGRASLPLAIFTVMANAPESLVGSLCVVYITGAALLLMLGVLLATRLKRNV